MQQEFNNQSFEKGIAFENYLEKNIFPKSDFDLVHKTHNPTQNNERYVESSLKPDFKFRDKKSKIEFYVEAKFRSNFDFENKLDLFETKQYNRFKNIDETESKVLVAIGVGGVAQNPQVIYFVPINDIQIVGIYKKELEKYIIPKNQSLNESLLVKLTTKSKTNNENIKPVESDTNNKEYQNSTSSKYKRILILSLFSILGLFVVYKMLAPTNASKSNPSIVSNKDSEQEVLLKKKIDNYYQSIESNNLEVLDYYICQSVDRWYNERNLSLSKIKKTQAWYINKFPYRKLKVEWESFNYTILSNGDFNVSYNIDYKIKSKYSAPFKTYKLNIKAIWTKELMLKSMYESKLE